MLATLATLLAGLLGYKLGRRRRQRDEEAELVPVEVVPAVREPEYVEGARFVISVDRVS